jgi:hypothetical protein
MIDPLVIQIGNVIHDAVCMELDTSDYTELESKEHSDRVDTAAKRIITLVEQDIARRLLSAEAVDALAGIEISALNESIREIKHRPGRAWDLNTDSPRAIVDMRNPYRFTVPKALAAIGITVEEQVVS